MLIDHRVANRERDPRRLAVSPDNFDVQIRHLAQTRRVMALSDLVAACREKRIPNGAVAITFDDGYANCSAGAAAP